MENRDLAKTILDIVNTETNDYDAIDKVIEILDGYSIISKVEENAKMLMENCAWTLRWDYNGLEQYKVKDITIFQKEWNQTLITKINQISAQISQATLTGPAKIIKTHPHLKKLFETLEYYKDGDILGRYMVEYDENLYLNEVFIYQSTWNKVKSIPKTTVGIADGEMATVTFIPTSDFTIDENTEFNSKLIGCIIVDNYE